MNAGFATTGGNRPSKRWPPIGSLSTDYWLFRVDLRLKRMRNGADHHFGRGRRHLAGWAYAVTEAFDEQLSDRIEHDLDNVASSNATQS